MTMPRSLGDTLKVWHFVVAVILQSGALIATGAWWAATTDADIKGLKRETVTNTTRLEAVSANVYRIDNEGSRVWAMQKPADQRTTEKLETRLGAIEDKFNQINLQMTRLITISEQNQRLLKGN